MVAVLVVGFISLIGFVLYGKSMQCFLGLQDELGLNTDLDRDIHAGQPTAIAHVFA